MKTSELTGAALDWAVAKCEGRAVDSVSDAELEGFIRDDPEKVWAWDLPKYSTDPVQGFPIIEREIFRLFRNVGGTFTAQIKFEVQIPTEDRGTSLGTSYTEHVNEAGSTMLEAGMRCYVKYKLGDEIEVPEELCS